jgi:phosphoglycerate dehydrogenase-like enzyme
VVVTVSVRGREGLPAPDLAVLEALADVRHLRREGRMTAADARRCLAGAEIVALTPKVAPHLDAALLAQLGRLRGIVVYATGLDLLDLPLLGAHRVVVRNLPGYSTVSVAEHTLGLLLALAHRIHLGHDRARGLVPPTTSLRGVELAGRTLGVIGLGRIGGRVAASARALGMHVVAHEPGPLAPVGVPLLTLHDLLRTADAVTLHCPAVHRAPPLLGPAELALLSPDALLVNTSRPSLVDTAAVIAAIRAGRLRGYAVDDEVIGPEDADLSAEGRILQTGHCAWWTDEALARGAAAWTRATIDLVRELAVPAMQEVAS